MNKLKPTSAEYYKNCEITLKAPNGNTLTICTPSSMLLYSLLGGFYACSKKCWKFGIPLILITLALLPIAPFGIFFINALTETSFRKHYINKLKKEGYTPLNLEEANQRLEIRNIGIKF